MNLIVVTCFLVFLSIFVAGERSDNKRNIGKIIKLLHKDRNTPNKLRAPRVHINEVPNSKLRVPGHSLIKPKRTMLKSAAKFPKDNLKLVLGNENNLGITFGKTSERVLYSGFRKRNDLLETILKAVADNQENYKKKRNSENVLDHLDNLEVVINDDDSSSVEKSGESGNNRDSEDSNSNQDLIVLNIDSDDETLDKRTNRIEALLNKNLPIARNVVPKKETFEAKTKKIRAFVNNELKKVYSLNERTKKIQDFLNNETPRYKMKSSLEDKTNYIQNLLNQAPMIPYINTLNNHDTNLQVYQNRLITVDEDENNANEVLDQYSSENESGDSDSVWHPDLRRRLKKKKKYRDRSSKYSHSVTSGSDESSSSDYERNPGNPFTVHKNKYKQNWLWNHYMDGDHMNINPYGPSFGSIGPTGAELFFGRKWWYYNQDDYKPMR